MKGNQSFLSSNIFFSRQNIKKFAFSDVTSLRWFAVRPVRYALPWCVVFHRWFKNRTLRTNSDQTRPGVSHQEVPREQAIFNVSSIVNANFFLASIESTLFFRSYQKNRKQRVTMSKQSQTTANAPAPKDPVLCKMGCGFFVSKERR